LFIALVPSLWERVRVRGIFKSPHPSPPLEREGKHLKT